MGKISAKDATITVDDAADTAREISTDVISYEIQWGIEPHDVTGFSDGWKNSIPGQYIAGITLNCLWNTLADTGAYTVLSGILNDGAKTVTILADGEEFEGEFMLDGVEVGGNADGTPISLGSCHFSPAGTTIAAWTTP